MNSDDPVAPYETLVYHGSSIKIDTKGKTVVVPTGNPTLLPLFNEYVENADRLTTAESPFGGMKGSYPPDYAVGTAYTPSDGIYLTDTSGTISTKTLTAGKLTELGLLTVDTDAHTITEEFVIRNDGAGTDVQVIDNCSSAAGWNGAIGTGYVITVVDGQLKVTGTTDSNGRLVIGKTVSANWSTTKFITFDLTSTSGGYVYAKIVTGAGNEHLYSTSRFALSAGVRTHFVLPIEAPQGTTGALPSFTAGTFNSAAVTLIQFGVAGLSSTTAAEYYLDNIIICNGTWAQVEVAVPDNLQMRIDGSKTIPKIELRAYNGTGYDTNINFYDGANYVFRGSVMPFLDGTSSYHIFGANKSGIFTLPGNKGETVSMAQSYTDLPTQLRRATLSNLYGTKKRFVLALFMPPSDNGRTNLNKCRLKLVTYYDDTNGNTVPDLSGNGNTGTIVGGVTKLNDGGLKFDGSTGYVDFGASTALKQTSAFSIEARFIPGPLNSQRDIFRCGYTGDSKLGVLLYTSSTNYVSFAVGNGSVLGLVQASGGYVTPGTEEHIVAVYDGINCKLYRNGVLAGTSVDAVAPVVYSSGSAKLSAGNVVSEYNGTLKTFKYYNTALSADDVALLYSGSEVSGASVIVIPTVSNMGATTYELSNDSSASTGLHHMVKPWIALLEDDTQEIDFYLFDERPKNLKYKQDESGKIYELEVFPGNGNCYHGRIKYSGLTRDTNSDGIPDCLDASVEGSIANFLRTYDFAKDWYYEYDLSASAISANDFSITEESLDIVPFAVPEGDSVSDTNNVILPVAETVSTATGNVSLVDVRGLSAVRVRDTSYTNSGECKVWDTVTAGNTDVATWVRVYNTNWVFSGDKVIENGIIRILYSSTATYSCNLYYHNGSSWVYDRYIRIGVGGSYNSTISTVNFQTISSDAVSLTLRLSGYDQYPTDIHYVNINLIRGVYSAKFTILDTSVINGAGVRIYDETGTVNPLVCTNTIHDFRFSETDSSYYLSDSSGLGYSLNTSGGVIRFQCDPKTTNMRYRLVGTTRYCYGIVYNDDAPYSIFVGAIPYSQQMYWEAESLTGYGITVVSDVDTYSGQAVEIRRPKAYNNHITVDLTGMCVANQKIKIYVRAKCPLADKLQLYVHSASSSKIIALANPVLTIGSYAYYSLEFTPLSTDLGQAVRFFIKNMCDIGAEYPIIVDYIVAVPTSLIEKHAKRALWNASPMTSTFKSSKR